MKEEIEKIKEEIKRLEKTTAGQGNPKLQAARDLLDFAVKSITQGDLLQAESSIKVAKRNIARVTSKVS